MVEIYISWVKGIIQDKEALDILGKSGVVSGIEMSNIGEDIDRIHDAGLKVSSHTPGLELTLNLANPGYMDAFAGEQGERLIQTVRESDATTVGFHCGYSAESVYKMQAYPNVPKEGTVIADREALLKRIVGNIVSLESRMNEGLPSQAQKQVVIETLDYSRQRQIPWDRQTQQFSDKEKQMIENVVAEYGINAGLLYVTAPEFVREVLDRSASSNVRPIGFLFDVAHNFISADAKRNESSFAGSVDEYFDEMLAAVGDRTYQIHLAVPSGNSEEGYSDNHNIFGRDGVITDKIVSLAKVVVMRSPKLDTVTLEMKTGLDTLEHAKEMVRQAEYAMKQLF
jgi:hypothetical protein